MHTDLHLKKTILSVLYSSSFESAYVLIKSSLFSKTPLITTNKIGLEDLHGMMPLFSFLFFRSELTETQHYQVEEDECGCQGQVSMASIVKKASHAKLILCVLDRKNNNLNGDLVGGKNR